jgi:demethylmacrocin O-methyltransferase
MNNYSTDKIDSGLIYEYEGTLSRLRNKPIKMLEVGYLRGDFLRWFRDNFKQSKVFGIDVKEPLELEDNEDGRIKMFQVNQNDSEGLILFGSKYGNFDIIIDDGAHRDVETKNTFDCLWRFLNPGGWYAIEDWGAHYKHSQYGEMGKVIADIMINKNKLGIEQLKLFCNQSFVSIAWFKKNL